MEGRILFEQGTTELLLRLTQFDEEQDWRRVPTNNLEQEFSAYVASMARCLISPDVSPQPTVAYYLALRDVVTSLPIAAPQRSVEALDNVVRFQAFYGDVKERYTKLHRSCFT